MAVSAPTTLPAPARVPAPAHWASILLIATFVSGCADPSEVTRCADSLSGIWRAESDEADTRAASGERLAFHIVDRGATVDIYPMFDDSHPPTGDKATSEIVYTPGLFVIERITGTGEVLGMTGQRIARVTRAATTCTLTAQASIRSCERDALELSWLEHRYIDWRTCSSVTSARFRRVVLSRQP